MRINLNMPDDLIAKIDQSAKKLYLTRTAWIITAVNNRLQADESIERLPELKKMIEDAFKYDERKKNESKLLEP